MRQEGEGSLEGKDLATRLKIRRSHLELTQKQMALKIGVPHTTYREWEYGRQIQSPEMLLRVASICQVSLHELITGEKAKPNQQIKELDQIISRLLSLKSNLVSLSDA